MPVERCNVAALRVVKRQVVWVTMFRFAAGPIAKKAPDCSRARRITNDVLSRITFETDSQDHLLFGERVTYAEHVLRDCF